MSTKDLEAKLASLSASQRVQVVAALILCAIALALRIAFAATEPVNTGDVLRHLYTGVYVLRDGLHASGIPLAVLNPDLAWIASSSRPYSYPPLALFFFTLIAAIHSSVFAAKAVLTIVEGVNAALLWKVTRDPWIAVIAWCAPLGMWWASSEAQFEPVQSFFVLWALAMLHRRPAIALGLLVLAIQVKMTAILMLPYFIWRICKDAGQVQVKRTLTHAAVATAIAGVPTLIATLYYPAITNVFAYSTPMRLNPFHWNLFNPYLTGTWLPGKIWMQTTTWLLLLLLLGGALRSRQWMQYSGALALVILFKSATHVQFWYWLALVPFLACIDNRRLRRALFLVWAFVDINAPGQMLLGPFGYQVRETYYDIGIFTPLNSTLPF